MNVSEAFLLFIIAELFSLAVLIWKISNSYGRLQNADILNHKDINRLGNEMRRYNRITWQRVDNIEEFLAEKHAYFPRSITLFEENEYIDEE